VGCGIAVRAFVPAEREVVIQQSTDIPVILKDFSLWYLYEECSKADESTYRETTYCIDEWEK
jgi:hypothetical protein